MLIVTTVTRRNANTDRMRRSFERFGYEVADSYGGRGGSEGRRQRDESLKQLLDRAPHEYVCYSDAADTICQREFTLPDYLVYATEKRFWPPLNEVQHRIDMESYPKAPPSTLWGYLNGGCFGGPRRLIIEFWERYRDRVGVREVNGQMALHLCLVEATKDGFPIKLDFNCDYFQCIAHEGHNPEFTRGEPGELIQNRVTGTTPAVFHGNGTTDMKFISDRIL